MIESPSLPSRPYEHCTVIGSLYTMLAVRVTQSPIIQICYASVGILMECLLEGGWFSRGQSPRENHPPEGRRSIRIPTLA